MKKIKQWLKTLLWTMPLAMACATPLKRQQDMALLSKASRAECQHAKPRCREVEPCQRRALEALRSLQAWNEAIASERETPEVMADALGAEAAAKVVCRAAKVQP